MLTLFLLISIVALTAFLSAGISPATLFPLTVFLCATGLYSSAKTQRKYPCNLLTLSTLALLVLLVMTILPLPSFLTPLMNAHRSIQNTVAETAIKQAIDIGLIDSFSPFFSVSRNRSGTIRIILLLICTFSLGSITAQLEQKKRIMFIQLLLAISILLAVAGFLGQWIIPQGKSIWWLFRVAHGSPVACFINRNHFGGYLAMLAPSALVLATTRYHNKQPMMGALWSIAFTILSFAILSSLSRGAWLAWLFSTIATFIFLTRKTKHRKTMVAGICIALISIPIIFCTTSRTDVAERLASFKNITNTNSANMRFTTWKDSLRITKDYPLLGTGANGFRMTFPQYRTSSSRKEFKHIENEYLQIPIETGLLGTILIIIILTRLLHLWRIERDPDSPDESTITACVLGAIVAVAIHAFLDFAIRVPLYAMTLSSLMGLSLRASPKQTSDPDTSGLHPRHYYLFGMLFPVLILVFGGIDSAKLDSPDYIKQASPARLCRTLTYAPSSWQTWYHLGNASIKSGLPDSYEFGEHCITQATKYDPLNYRLWTRLCRVRLYLKDEEGAEDAYRRLKKLRSWVTIKELEHLDAN